MLKLRVHGIKDGESQFTLEEDARTIKDLPEEFFGIIKVEGILTKIGKRYTVVGNVRCNAKLICDISLDEYTEEIDAHFEYTYSVNNELYFLLRNRGEHETESGEIILHEDDQFIDLTEELRQELIVNIPMKKIAPNFRGKSLKDLYPEIMVDDDENDQQWSNKSNIKFIKK